MTIDVAPVPLPDPRPRVMFNKDFPSLKFEREDEYGFKFNERLDKAYWRACRADADRAKAIAINPKLGR